MTLNPQYGWTDTGSPNRVSHGKPHIVKVQRELKAIDNPMGGIGINIGELFYVVPHKCVAIKKIPRHLFFFISNTCHYAQLHKVK